MLGLQNARLGLRAKRSCVCVEQIRHGPSRKHGARGSLAVANVSAIKSWIINATSSSTILLINSRHRYIIRGQAFLQGDICTEDEPEQAKKYEQRLPLSPL